jgi:hypothetical protein
MPRKKWSQIAPKTVGQRRALLKRCGRKAFLDPDNLTYPIMAARGPCVPNCEGLKAARSRAGGQVTIQGRKRSTAAKAKKRKAKSIHTKANRASKRAACY